MEQKRLFYQRHGVEEYYIYDPDRVTLEGWQRQGDILVRIGDMQGWISLLLKIRFELDPKDLDNELKIYRPSGKLFLNVIEQEAQLSEAERFAVQQLQRAQQEQQEKELAQSRAQQEYLRAEQERQEKELAQKRIEELLAQLRALGIEPNE